MPQAALFFPFFVFSSIQSPPPPPPPPRAAYLENGENGVDDHHHRQGQQDRGHAERVGDLRDGLQGRQHKEVGVRHLPPGVELLHQEPREEVQVGVLLTNSAVSGPFRGQGRSGGDRLVDWSIGRSIDR